MSTHAERVRGIVNNTTQHNTTLERNTRKKAPQQDRNSGQREGLLMLVSALVINRVKGAA